MSECWTLRRYCASAEKEPLLQGREKFERAVTSRILFHGIP